MRVDLILKRQVFGLLFGYVDQVAAVDHLVEFSDGLLVFGRVGVAHVEEIV